MTHETIPIAIRMRLGGKSVELVLQTPVGPVRPNEMMPVFHALTDTLVSAAACEAEHGARRVSCRPNCDACCWQIVPIAEPEAAWIREVVKRLPKPQRDRVKARFSNALRRLADAGLLDRLRKRGPMSDDEVLALANAYVDLEIPCPFLEDESCLIHPDRPMMCREYLVTSPPENCRGPGPRQIQRVPMPARVSSVVARLGREDQPGERPFIPMILALQWADEHPDRTPRRPGGEILEELFARLGRA